MINLHDDILSGLEIRACEVIMDQTDGQLEYTVQQLSNEPEYDYVNYFVVPQGGICFPVKKNFFIDLVLNELEYRNI